MTKENVRAEKEKQSEVEARRREVLCFERVVKFCLSF